jgi:hypothetical protein
MISNLNELKLWILTVVIWLLLGLTWAQAQSGGPGSGGAYAGASGAFGPGVGLTYTGPKRGEAKARALAQRLGYPMVVAPRAAPKCESWRTSCEHLTRNNERSRK